MKAVVMRNESLDVEQLRDPEPGPGEEFAQTLADLADGRLEAEPTITSVVQPEGVAQAFDTLAKPEDEAKIIINFD